MRVPQGIAQDKVISVMMQRVTRTLISVFSNPKLMVPPVMMGYGAQKMMYALVVRVEGPPVTAHRWGINVMMGCVMRIQVSVFPNPN